MMIYPLKDQVLKNLGFLPNFQQNELINALSKFVDSPNNESLFLLQGYAGTGKTSILGAFVKAMSQFRRKTVLLAPTGRAAKVLSTHAEHPAFTIHKKIYRQQKFSADIAGFQVMDNLHKDTLFVVDEASMISDYSDKAGFGSGSLLDDLVEYVYQGHNCRLLLLGDIAQLPPVGQVYSPAMRADSFSRFALEVISFNLTEVARQSNESGILHNATLLREYMIKGEPYDIPKLELDGFGDIQRVNGEDLIETISDAYSHSGIEETLIVTRSNKRANSFNQGVRFQLLFREDELSAGDMLLVAKNNYFWSKEIDGIDFIANGDIVEVKRVRRSYEIHGFRFVDVEVILPDYDVEVEVRILLDTLHSETAALPSDKQQHLFESVYSDYEGLPTQRDRMQAIKGDPFFNALQVKYAFAVTCHKAQGGQWKEVFIDMGMINKEHLGLDFYRWLYTAITRATDKVWLVNVDDEFIADTK